MFACGATGFLAKWEVCVWWVSRLVVFVSVRMRRVGGGAIKLMLGPRVGRGA